jgi:transcription termination/antitermination protein NusG
LSDIPSNTAISASPVSDSVRMTPRDVTQSPVWLAAYTTPRHEKSVVRHLEVRDVEYFLPLYKAERKWRNGCKVEVEFPIFPNYVFVHVDRRASYRVLDAPGVVAFAGSGRLPALVPDSEIEWLRNELPLRKFEPHPYLVVGSRVRIKSGPMAGMNGVLIRKKGGFRVVLSIDLIRQSVAVEVGIDEIERCV